MTGHQMDLELGRGIAGMPAEGIKPPYLMNVETREIYAYSADLEKMTSPRFAPFYGKVPSPDFAKGVPIAAREVALEDDLDSLNDDQRIARIAGVVHLIPKDDVTDKGNPGLIAIEKATGLKNVKRIEVNKALKMRADMLRERNPHNKTVESEPEEGDTE